MIDARRAIGTTADRGQTTLDFAIAASVFLLAVAFVVAFIPSMFDPFGSSDGSLFLVGERAASYLVEDLLVVSLSEPSLLDGGCTIAFFTENATLAAANDCGFDPDETATTAAAIGIAGGHPIDRHANVTLYPLNATDSPPTPIETDGGERLQVGPSGPPDHAAAVSRIVRIDDGSGIDAEATEFRLTVRVW
ncbi:MAG: DUF7287 family protein [Halobacteriota archaeon]